jgi:hypothetical protein
MRRLPSPALVVACLALAVALGGMGYAAATLPRGSVGTAQLKNASVTPAKVAKGPAVRVYKTSTQQFLNDITTAVVWQRQSYDVGGMWSPAHPTRLRASRAGLYALAATLIMTGGSGYGSSIRQNGTRTIAYGVFGSGTSASVSTVVRLKKGEFVELAAINNNPSVATLIVCPQPGHVCPAMTMTWIGP